MKFFNLLSLLPLVAAAPSPLNVKLERAGNSLITATITNTGNKDIRIFKAGSIFDDIPTEKVKIAHKDGTEIPFKGIRVALKTHDLDDDSFQHIPAGKSVDVTFDVARTHDLSKGGDFHILSEGILQYAQDKSNKITGSAAFASNKLSSNVDGLLAGAAHKEMQTKRTYLQNDCTGSRGQAQANANRNCAAMASAAYYAATQAPDSKIQQYYHDASQRTRSIIQGIFSRVYDECNNTPGGGSNTYCTDVDNSCGQNILAYTYYTGHYQVYCDLHYTYPAVAGCRYMDQASTVLHESTHLDYVGYTHDHAYGYQGSTSLNTQASLDNADTYRYFANDVYNRC